MLVFSDLRYLFHNRSVQQLTAHHPAFVRKFVKVCQVFTPNKRIASSHAEYEADSWISMFNVTLSLSQVIKVYGEALRILGAITTVVREFLALSPQIGSTRKSSPSRCCTRSSLVMHTINLLKHVDILSKESLKQIGVSGVRDLFLCPFYEGAILTLIDFPLQDHRRIIGRQQPPYPWPAPLARCGLLSFFRCEVEKSPAKLPFQRAIRRKIVHALAVGPSVSQRGWWMMYLSSALLRTYFTSAHKRKEMEVILRNRLPKKTGVKDPVIVPKPSTITSGPFSILPSFLESEALLQVMLYAIFNHVPEVVQPPRKVLSPAAPVPGVEGVKKRAAKAREEVIMAELQAQQASFSLNLEEKEEENRRSESAIVTASRHVLEREVSMKDLAAEFCSEVTIYRGRVTDITIVDVGLEPLREFNTSFRQRFPSPIAQCYVRQQPQHQDSDVTAIPSLDLAQLAIRTRATQSNKNKFK
ncbi:hypothetical protein P692DRAFT_20878924 [Suillus brevipes Sb2]|nr:hypothetical protein P692DRAFT_20878924 [Suillus brevipes Sb2]